MHTQKTHDVSRGHSERVAEEVIHRKPNLLNLHVRLLASRTVKKIVCWFSRSEYWVLFGQPSRPNAQVRVCLFHAGTPECYL